MSTTAAASPPAAEPGIMPMAGNDTVADVIEALGLEPEGAEGAAEAPAAKPETAPAKDKPETGDDAAKDKGKGEDDKPAEQDAAGDEDPDVAELRAINARSRARREARERARREAQSQARPAAPATTTEPEKPAPATKPAEKPQPPPQSETFAAFKDIIKAIDDLARDDAEAAAQPTGTPAEQQAASAERKALVEELRGKLDALTEALKGQDTDLKKKVEDLTERLTVNERHRNAQEYIGVQLDAIEAEIPLLMSPETVRTLVRGHGSITGAPGTRYRNAIDVVHDAADKFYEKYKTTPDLKALARRIEKKLKGASPEKKPTEATNEKPPQSRKTLSSSHGSPAAARTGPDQRSSKDAVSDFFNALGEDPE